jgi:hypothetical protein
MNDDTLFYDYGDAMSEEEKQLYKKGELILKECIANLISRGVIDTSKSIIEASSYYSEYGVHNLHPNHPLIKKLLELEVGERHQHKQLMCSAFDIVHKYYSGVKNCDIEKGHKYGVEYRITTPLDQLEYCCNVVFEKVESGNQEKIKVVELEIPHVQLLLEFVPIDDESHTHPTKWVLAYRDAVADVVEDQSQKRDYIKVAMTSAVEDQIAEYLEDIVNTELGLSRQR